jgi:(2Fe-2S) ferredoxin
LLAVEFGDNANRVRFAPQLTAPQLDLPIGRRHVTTEEKGGKLMAKASGYRVFVCTKQRTEAGEGGCHDCGGAAVYAAFDQAIAAQALTDRVKLKASGCLDHCESGAVAMVFRPQRMEWNWLPKKLQTKIQKKFGRDRVFYGHLQPEDVPELVQQHLGQGKVVERVMI